LFALGDEPLALFAEFDQYTEGADEIGFARSVA